MARVLRRTVITGGVTYPPGTAETAELAKKITNPKAWEGEPDPAPAPKKRAAKGSTAKAPASPPEEPPRGGEGSTEEAWRAYAAALGIEVTEDDGRDDIIAAVDARSENQ